MPGLTAGIDAEFRHAVCAASSGTAVVGSWVEHVRIGRAVQRRQYCSGHSRNAGRRIADEIHLTRQSAVDGLWRPGDRAAGGGDDAHDGAGSSAAADSPVSGHCPVHFAGLRAGLSLRHADVAFIAFAGRPSFNVLMRQSPFWQALSVALLLNILAMRPASCLPGHSRCWRRGLLISGCIRQEN